MSFIDIRDREKFWDFVTKNFFAMPSWLRNTLLVSLVIGFFYFGYIRKQIVFQHEMQKTEEIHSNLEKINQKIVKIEELRIANEDMLYNIEEVRSIVHYLSDLHRNQTEIIVRAFKKSLSEEDYSNLRTDLEECDNDYRDFVNSTFSEKTKKYLKKKKDADE